MKRAISTVLFMMGITAVFIGMLAFLNGMTQSRIQTNLKMQESKSILYAFGILPEGADESLLSGTMTTEDLGWDDYRLLKTIEEQLSIVRLPVPEEAQEFLSGSMLAPGDSVPIYIHLVPPDSICAIGFYMRGKGLWGTIQAFMAVTPDFKRAVGIDFTEQVETPGLGARITEQEFKGFFRNLDISGIIRSSASPIQMVRSKAEPNTLKATPQLQAVTGATQTCNGVLNMLQSDLKFYYRLIQMNQTLLQMRG